MDLFAPFASLIVIPLCSLLNNMGGQSKTIPTPRVTCRMVGQALAFGMAYALYDHPLWLTLAVTVAAGGGVALWAMWKVGPGFMAVDDGDMYDMRDYTQYVWLTELADAITGVNQKTLLSYSQIRNWGRVWMAIRGLAMIPLFVFLAFFLSPITAVFGLMGAWKGQIYYSSHTVSDAEYKEGAMIGGLFWLALLLNYLAVSYGW